MLKPKFYLIEAVWIAIGCFCPFFLSPANSECRWQEFWGCEWNSQMWKSRIWKKIIHFRVPDNNKFSWSLHNCASCAFCRFNYCVNYYILTLTRSVHKIRLTEGEVRQRKQLYLHGKSIPRGLGTRHAAEPVSLFMPYYRQWSWSSQGASLKTDWIKSKWGSFHGLALAGSHHSSASQILEADVCKLITWPLNSSKPPKVLYYVSTGLRNRYVLLANWITYGVD